MSFGGEKCETGKRTGVKCKRKRKGKEKKKGGEKKEKMGS
jgi:hypothetical protein